MGNCLTPGVGNCVTFDKAVHATVDEILDELLQLAKVNLVMLVKRSEQGTMDTFIRCHGSPFSCKAPSRSAWSQPV